MKTMKYAILLSMNLAVIAADWNGFRGPNGTGTSRETGLPGELAPDKNLAWKAETLKGNSSPVVAGGRVYLTGAEGDERVVMCFDAAKGGLIWRRGVTKARSETAHPLNGPATPSVATDGKMVFAFFPEFGLVAYDANGVEKWRAPMGPFTSIQGLAASPVLAGGNVIQLIDTPEEAYVAAFDAKSGKPAWKAERPMGILGSYSTPSLYRPAAGPEQLVVAGAVELTGYQAKTGERLWWARGVTNGPAALPLISGETVYTMEPKAEAGTASDFPRMLKQADKDGDGKIALTEVAGDTTSDRILHRLFKAVDKFSGNGDGVLVQEEWDKSFSPDQPNGGLVRLRLDGKGDVSEKNVMWRYGKGLPYTTAPLEYQGVLYVVKQGGILMTFDPETGKLLGERRLGTALGEYYASPVAADGRIYFANKEGKVTAIRAGADWEVTSQHEFNEQIIATPAIADGRIYLRTEKALYCFAAAQPASETPKSSR
jgi:outer membrane protein assembly factor BamB